MTRRPALLAVDGGGSKIDAALLRRDGTVLGAARIPTTDYEENGGRATHAPGRWTRSPERAPTPASTPRSRWRCSASTAWRAPTCRSTTEDPAVAPRAEASPSEHLVRNDTFAVLRAGTAAPLGRRRRVRLRHELLRRGSRRQGHPLPRARADLGRLGRRRRPGRGRALVRDALPRTGAARRPRWPSWCRRTSASAGRGRCWRPSTTDGSRRTGSSSSRRSCSVRRPAGDACARGIVDRQADEIVAMATTAIRRLRMQKLDVDVVLGGGIFRTDDGAFLRAHPRRGARDRARGAGRRADRPAGGRRRLAGARSARGTRPPRTPARAVP